MTEHLHATGEISRVIKIQHLIEILEELKRDIRVDRIQCNQQGNLLFMDGSGLYLGYIDLGKEEVDKYPPEYISWHDDEGAIQ